MINEIIANFAKILMVFGLFSIAWKMLLLRKYDQVSEKKKIIIYNMHKAFFSLSTILGFIHGLTIVPDTLIYIITGWLLGIVMIILCTLGIWMGFKHDWKPYTKEENKSKFKLRLIKWILTVLCMVFLAMHHLLV